MSELKAELNDAEQEKAVEPRQLTHKSLLRHPVNCLPIHAPCALSLLLPVCKTSLTPRRTCCGHSMGWELYQDTLVRLIHPSLKRG
jgi:hypothetical protein